MHPNGLQSRWSKRFTVNSIAYLTQLNHISSSKMLFVFLVKDCQRTIRMEPQCYIFSWFSNKNILPFVQTIQQKKNPLYFVSVYEINCHHNIEADYNNAISVDFFSAVTLLEISVCKCKD